MHFSIKDNKNNGKFKSVTAVWYTNLDVQKRHEPLDLYKRYSPEEYPKYDNYEAINVNKVVDIPIDYTGVMGVPISFMEKHCPEQFKIIGLCASHGKVPRHIENESCYLNGKWVYSRILIQRKLK